MISFKEFLQLREDKYTARGSSGILNPSAILGKLPKKTKNPITVVSELI
jgi:hypothetical protein